MKARRLLYYAAKDTNVKGVLLRINSPGGTVGMSQELYDAVSEVRKHKPIVVSMGDVAASGGYYTAAAADRILANPGTLTASIGVILQTINAEKLLTDKLGIKAVTVKSGKFKDILSPYRPATEAELSLLQDIIDSSYHQFLEAVLNGRTRDIKDPEVRNNRIRAITAIADGRVVLGSQAVEIGLVDQTGGLEDAKRVLQNLAGERFNISRPDRLTLQEYESTFSIWDFLGLGAVQNLKPKMGAVLTPPESVIPNSIRYANQPLWLMESF
jgi:protease-4